jgi:hypothetical protein
MDRPTLPKFWNAAVHGMVTIAAMMPIESVFALQPFAQTPSGLARTTPNLIAQADGEIRVEYQPAQTSFYQTVSAALQQYQAFEAWAEMLSELLVLPRDITLSLQECGSARASYQPSASQITLCYELLEQFRQDFESLGMSASGEAPETAVSAGTFVFLHELGHALIYDWDLPVLGREEDAADQFATVLLSLGGQESLRLAWAAAVQLHIAASQQTSQAWDDHSSDLQRFYSIACLSYGSNPTEYPDLPETILPTERREECVGEYQQISRSWLQLIGPHLRK